MQSQFLDAVDPSSGQGLRVQFVWHQDRYAHTVALLRDGQLLPVLASLEGSDETIWPPSPPLQQLTIQQQGDRHVALLVGMAGQCHWSMSVEVDARRPAIGFDVACRLEQRPAVWLGSSYRCMVSPRWTDNEQATLLPLGDAACQVSCDSSAENGAVALRIVDATLRVDATQQAPIGTARWRYTIQPAEASTEPPAGASEGP